MAFVITFSHLAIFFISIIIYIFIVFLVVILA